MVWGGECQGGSGVQPKRPFGTYTCKDVLIVRSGSAARRAVYACLLVAWAVAVPTMSVQKSLPPCSTSPRTRRWWRGTAGIEPTGRWGGLVKSRCVSGAGGCVRYVRCLCLSLTDSYMPALVPCRTSYTLPARGLRPQGLDGRLGAAGGRKSGRVCYLLARRSLKAAPRVVGVTSRDVRT